MTASASTSSHPLPGASAPAPIAHDFRLPLRATDFDAGLPALLHAALSGASRRETLAGLCAHLARVLKLRLALLVRRADAGTFAIEAASAENGLWLELQHIPERWDGGVSSQGPASAALRAQGPVHVGIRDEGFALWRAAAESERVREILAVPLQDEAGTCVLELCFDSEIARGATAGTVTIGRLISSVQAFMADIATIERQALLAGALTTAGNAAFITDLEGTIVWSNPAFSVLSGYPAEQVRGRNPNLLRSGQQGTRYYRELWGTIRAGKVWSGETVDRARDGTEYTIQQTVSPVAREGRITHYVSIHQDIGRERRERRQLEVASHLSPQTGLLTFAAFEDEFEKARAGAPDAPMALVIVSIRGLQRALPAMGEEVEGLLGTALGRRVHEAIAAPDAAGSPRPFEYALLLRGDVSEARIEARLRTLEEKLAEPLPWLGGMPQLNIHCGSASYPAQGRTFRELWLKADRQLANEPYRRAHRNTPH
jgi:PAS domain S-box-containing protein